MINSRFEELQKRCKKYYRKKIIKFVFFVFFFLILMGIVLYFSFFKTDKIKTIEKNITISNSIKKPSTLNLKPVINLKEPVIKVKKDDKKISKDKIIKKKAKPIKQNKIEKKSILKLIVEKTNKETILLKNYNINKDFSSSIKLAEYYLNHKKYNKALNWAKNANKFDATRAESWIVYAKAEFSLGKKEDAIKSLQTYLHTFYSKKVAMLLEKYKTEE